MEAGKQKQARLQPGRLGGHKARKLKTPIGHGYTQSHTDKKGILIDEYIRLSEWIKNEKRKQNISTSIIILASIIVIILMFIYG